MKVVKGFRLYRFDPSKKKPEFTEHPDLEDLNRELKKMGYELKIKGFLKPYKFHNFHHNRTYKFAKLFETVANEIYVSHSYVVVGATEEEMERLSGNIVQIKRGNVLEEYSAALVLHGIDWIRAEPYNKLYYRGIIKELDRELGIEEEIKKIIDTSIDLKGYLYGVEKVEYID